MFIAHRTTWIARTALMASTCSLLLLDACSSPLASLPAVTSARQAEYRVAPGDKLKIVVQDLSEANGEYVVEESGMVSLPYIKQVSVGGKTYREIEQDLAAILLRVGIMSSDPVVNVAPVQLRPFYIVGEVNRPGEFEYRQGMTVLSALSAAGGYTYRASTGTVAITRLVDGAPSTARATESTPIQPGDQIRVFERWF